jgi:hypothetical protein
MRKSMRLKVATLYTLCFGLFLSLHAYAIDLQPGEIVAPPAGLNLVQTTYQMSERGDQYVNGRKQSADTKLSAHQLQLRYVRTFETFNMPSLVYVQTPMGYVHPDKVLNQYFDAKSGVGDTSLVYAVWPYANREKKEYWGIGAYLTLPSGQYDGGNATLNMGGNRYAYALQTGYQRPLSEKLHWMGAVDAVWFGSQDDFRPYQAYSGPDMKYQQDALYTIQTGLSYNLTPRLTLAGAYFFTEGGETSRDGLDQNDTTRLQRYQLTASSQFSFGRVTLQYGEDIKTKNGFFEDSRLILRFIKAF